MNEDQKELTIKLPNDLHRRLEEWAERSNSSLAAELRRSARERLEREEFEDASKKEREEFLRVRKEWASKIDPQTAEFIWIYGSILDPYGIYPPLEQDNFGRNYFVRAPGSDIWVLVNDLPGPVADAILRRNSDTKTDLLFLSDSWD